VALLCVSSACILVYIAIELAIKTCFTRMYDVVVERTCYTGLILSASACACAMSADGQ
jgi:hypothetical protein